MEKVDFINYDQVHQIGITCVRALTGDDVPLLGRCHNNLSLCNLLLRHLTISCELPDLDAKGFEPLRKVQNHFLNQGLHRSYIDDLGLREIKDSTRLVMRFPQFIEDSEHSHIGLSRLDEHSEGIN